jgi:hypothetical protein
MSLHLFGIRHHGPGCARSLRAALEELRPDVIVMEGPADAQEALPLGAHPGMVPPVALLLYPPDEPRRAVYYPFTRFSPEWQALRWGAEHQVPVRLMDLPLSLRLGCEQTTHDTTPASNPSDETPPPPSAAPATEGYHPPDNPPLESPDSDQAEAFPWRVDPLAQLAEAAGYGDHELWWEQQVEQRADATGLFAAILEAMRTVREEFPETSPRDLLREAHMRTVLRAVRREGPARMAVICGAWHAPVLDDAALDGKRPGCRVSEDQARLKGLTKTKTTATWIPWTHSRLTAHSGYGAGVRSPGWYDHLWTSRESAATRWITTAARLLRERELDASSASVIEAVRLADALAALRSLRSPGLAELNDAILAVLCHGQPAPLRLIHERLEVGDVLGQVPEESPAVPLAQDLARWQKSLRLKPATIRQVLDLDLRQPIDLQRSQLLHRLGLLHIDWGQHQSSGGRTSTFHEIWQLEWKPEFAIGLIEASVWGNTIELAATARVIDQSGRATELPQVTTWLRDAVLAGLPGAVDPLLARIQSLAAVGTDVRHLMDGLLPLAQLARYGDVRGTSAGEIEPIVVGMLERIVVGLGTACAGLDDEAAARLQESLAGVSQSLALLNRADLDRDWWQALRKLLDGGVHPLLRGWCCRALLEKGQLDDEELDRRARLALSPANPPAESAAWLAGLLKGSGLLLLQQEGVWQVFDRWLAELSPETFIEILPLIRRAFADFTGPERRQMGEKVRHLNTTADGAGRRTSPVPDIDTVDLARARQVLPILAHVLGVSLTPDS